MDENTSTPPSLPPPPPPQSAAPPPLITPQRPMRPASRGTGWMVLALVLLVLLGLSMLFNLSQFIPGPGSYHTTRVVGPRLDELVLEDNGAIDKVAVVEVTGIIAGESFDGGAYSIVELVKAQLKQAEEDGRVKAVVLKVDSPGGEVLASDEIYRAISEFQKKTRKPVVASMGSVAASGGYYVSAPCRWIVANELTLTGSIGVIMNSWNYRGLMDKVGVRPMTYKSGRFKDMLSGSRDPDTIPAEEIKMLNDLIDQTFTRFKTIVREGRHQAMQDRLQAESKGQELREDWEKYADGRVLSGSEAYRYGFVDELGGFREAVVRARKLAGIQRANVVEFRQRLDFSDLFRLFGKSEAKGVKIDLGVDLPRLKTGYLYLLPPTYIQ